MAVIKGLGGNVKLLVTNPKEEEERKNNPGNRIFSSTIKENKDDDIHK